MMLPDCCRWWAFTVDLLGVGLPGRGSMWSSQQACPSLGSGSLPLLCPASDGLAGVDMQLTLAIDS